ncbi:MAG: type II secretion system F family protein [Kiritimatiellae bacterium]|nr:type II secretion system F family protein [Kiritimatiellia bacterium]
MDFSAADAGLLLLVFAAACALAGAAFAAARDRAAEKALAARGGAGAVRAATRAAAGAFFAAALATAGASLAGASLAGSAVAALAAGAAAAAAPGLSARRRAARVESDFEAQILDLATALSNGLRAGLAPNAALAAAADRLPDPMSGELEAVLRETRQAGVPLPEALARLYGRHPSEDLALLVGSVSLTQQTGGSLATVLARLVETIRERTEFKRRLRAMTEQSRFEAAAMALAPVFVFLLLFFIDRPLMLPLVTTEQGWFALAADAAMSAVGFAIISKIGKIEV